MSRDTVRWCNGSLSCRRAPCGPFDVSSTYKYTGHPKLGREKNTVPLSRLQSFHEQRQLLEGDTRRQGELGVVGADSGGVCGQPRRQ